MNLLKGAGRKRVDELRPGSTAETFEQGLPVAGFDALGEDEEGLPGHVHLAYGLVEPLVERLLHFDLPAQAVTLELPDPPL